MCRWTLAESDGMTITTTTMTTTRNQRSVSIRKGGRGFGKGGRGFGKGGKDFGKGGKEKGKGVRTPAREVRTAAKGTRGVCFNCVKVGHKPGSVAAVGRWEPWMKRIMEAMRARYRWEPSRSAPFGTSAEWRSTRCRRYRLRMTQKTEIIKVQKMEVENGPKTKVIEITVD